MIFLMLAILINVYAEEDSEEVYAGKTSGSTIVSDSVSDFSLINDPSLIPEIQVNTTAVVNILGEGEKAYFRFVPTETNKYRFFSIGDSDPCGTLYDQDMNIIVALDDAADTDNFVIEYTLEKNVQYYLGVDYSDYSETGTIEVRLTVDNRLTASPIGDTIRVVELGGIATLEVKAFCDAGSLRYEWYCYSEEDHQWLLLEEAASSMLTLTDIRQPAQYRCKVYDEYGNLECIDFDVRIENGFNVSRKDDWIVYVDKGGSATLEIIATCREGEIFYQWMKNGIDIEGAVNSSYTVENVSEQADYSCRVRDEFGNQVGLGYSVRLQNHFNASAIGETDRRVSAGDSITLEVQASCSNGEVHYNWSAYSQFDNSHENFTDANTSSFTVENVQRSMVYQCYIRDDFGNAQNISFYITVDNEFVAAPKDGQWTVMAAQGDSVTLEVAASCRDGELMYQWYGEQGEIEGATNSSYTIEDFDNSMNSYRCRVWDTYENNTTIGFSVSIDNQLVARAVGNTDYKITVGDSVTMEVEASCNSGELHYDWFANPQNGNQWQHIVNANTSSYRAENLQEAMTYECHVQDDFGNSEFIFFHISIDNELVAEPKDRKWRVNVEQGGSVTLEVVASCREGELAYQWYGEEGIIEGARTASYTVENVENSTRYWCHVSDIYGNYFDINISVFLENHLLVKPVGSLDKYVAIGDSVTLEVEASCDRGELYYEWYEYYIKDDVWKDLPDVTSSSYTASDIQQAMRYQCSVRDEYGNSEYIMFWVSLDNRLQAGPVEKSNYTVEPGTDLILGVNASCSQGGIAYQWMSREYNSSGGWYYFAEIENECNSTLAVSDIQSAKVYQCVVIDEYGNQVYCTFSINIDSGLSVSPIGERRYTINQGDSISLAVQATVKGGNLTYRWGRLEFRNGVYHETILENEVLSSITVENVQYAAEFFCQVTDDYSNERSVYFDVSIENGLSAEAKGNTVFYIHNGDTVSMSVTASCNSGEIQYSWQGYYRDGYYSGPVNLSSNTGDSVTLTDAKIGTECSCTVSDSYGNIEQIYFQFKDFTDRVGYVRLKEGQEVLLPVSEESGTLLSTTIEDGSSVSIDGARVTALEEGYTTVKAEYTNYIKTLTFVVYQDTGTFTLPNGLTIIEEEAFAGYANAVRFVELGNSVSFVGQDVFTYDSLVQLVVTSSSTQFAGRIFYEADPTIICPQGSTAEAYAIQHNISYVYPG